MIREVRYKGIFETLRKEILSGKVIVPFNGGEGNTSDKAVGK